MDTTVVLVIIIVFSFVTSRVLRRYFPDYVAFSGAEFIALGVLLGPIALGFVATPTLVHLESIVALLLGLVGFTLGLQGREHVREWRLLAPRILTSVITIGVVGLGCWGFLATFGGGALSGSAALAVAGTFGVVASVSSVSRIDTVARLWHAEGWVTRNLRTFAVVGDVLAISCFGLIAAAERAERNAQATPLLVAVPTSGLGQQVQTFMVQLDAWGWWAVSIAVGLLCGVLFIFFLGRVKTTPHIFLATIGCILFASGVATALEVSPLFVNLIVGTTIALGSSDGAQLAPVIQRLEAPALILLLLLAGIFFVPLDPLRLWAFVPVFLILRFTALRFGAWLGLLGIRDRPPARRFGMGLLSSGIIAVAIAMDAVLMKTESAPFVLATFMVSMLIQDILATQALRRVLADAEEIHTDMRHTAVQASSDQTEGGEP